MKGHHVGVWVSHQLGVCRGCGGEDDAGPARDLRHVRLYVTPRGSLRSWGYGGVAAAKGVIPFPTEDAPGIQWSLGNGDVTSQDTLETTIQAFGKMCREYQEYTVTTRQT